MVEFADFWKRLDGARAGTKYEDMERLFKDAGGISRSTWYSYQRWFEGGQGTSPRVSFLSHVAGLLRLSLVLDLRGGASLATPGGSERTGVDDIDAVVEWMLRLGPEARHEVREAAMRKIAELASLPPEGDDDNGRRPPPK